MLFVRAGTRPHEACHVQKCTEDSPQGDIERVAEFSILAESPGPDELRTKDRVEVVDGNSQEGIVEDRAEPSESGQGQEKEKLLHGIPRNESRRALTARSAVAVQECCRTTQSRARSPSI